MVRAFNFIITILFFSVTSFANSLDSCKIVLVGFKKTDGLIIFRNSQAVEGNLTPFSLTGQKERKLFIPSPVMFYTANDKCAPFFLMPNDVLTITKNKYDYTFSFDNATRTNEQNLLWKIYHETGPIYGTKSKENEELFATEKIKNQISKETDIASILNNREKFLKNLFDRRISLINEFKKHDNISAYFENYIKKYFFYAYLGSIMKGFNLFDLSPKLKIEVKQVLDFDEKDSSLLQIDSYRGFLNSYNYLLEKFLNCSNSLCRLTAITQNFNSSARDYLLFKEIKNQLDQTDTSTKSAINYFKSFCKNDKYTAIVEYETKLVYRVGNNSSDDFIVNQNIDEYNLAEYLNERKYKIIIVDFWASWCEPCIRELPSFENLMAEYSSNGNITFLFISMDKSVNDWQKAYKSFKFMDEQNNYLLKNNFKAAFSKKYTIKSIPRIMIIGKDNIIISKEAPDADSKEFKKIIDKIFENNKRKAA